MSNRLAGLFSDHPILQASLLCRDLSWNQHGELTIHNEFTSLKRGETYDFLVLNIWTDPWGGETRFKEKVELLGPGGELLGVAENDPFSIAAPNRRQINYTRFEKVTFLQSGCYRVRVTLRNVAGLEVFEFIHTLVVP